MISYKGLTEPGFMDINVFGVSVVSLADVPKRDYVYEGAFQASGAGDCQKLPL